LEQLFELATFGVKHGGEAISAGHIPHLARRFTAFKTSGFCYTGLRLHGLLNR
jgi:hypothetical protein